MKTPNLPNLLTISRIVFVFIFVVLATIADKAFIASNSVLFDIRLGAYILAIIAGATDLLDGYLARRWNQVTDFGALMDPLADKIFVTASMLIAVECRLMPAWIAIAVLCREFMVTGLRTLAAKKQIVISADRWGKLKTALQMLMLAIAGASWVWEFDLQQEKWFSIRLWYVWIAYLCGIVLVTVGSGVGYFVRYSFLYLDTNSKDKKLD
ncbi:MAG: CDP-diacylglycerol--glycerol-3-phosphate 3-phosphatidyltransferase [Victivallales bacterium]|jgi:CDP-diacylglycerol--glycerol-3-phosphate 3-phosphatidyltransferase|nr:CDP-diacylglycerol--glycerol-3-phosphate 3-phosphatidyltransferase [Victivallales bacterium]